MTSASPRTIGSACFVAAALLTSGAWWGVPAGASGLRQEPPATTTTVAPTAPADDHPHESVDVLRADAQEVRAALDATATKRSEAQGRLTASRTAAAEATTAAAEAEQAERAAAAKARKLDADVKEAAVNAFIGTGRDVPLGVFAIDDVQDAAWESTVLQYQAEQLDALLDEQQAAHDRLDAQRRAAATAAADAAAAEQAASIEVDQLIQLESRQAELVRQVDDRLDAALSEAAALAALDAQAAANLATQEQELATAAAQSVTNPPPPAETPVKGTPVVRTPATTAPPTTAKPGPSPATTAVPPTTVPSPPVTTPSPVDTVNVGGFVVARSIADQFSRLLAAAQAAGLQLGGSAYRDINVQIDLRRQHCGPTDYDVWQRPASQCSPPTAIPGRSMHEKGLAIDFTCARVLLTRADPCFAWLAANAASYGFLNLPSEPWHWSTNGN